MERNKPLGFVWVAVFIMVLVLGVMIGKHSNKPNTSVAASTTPVNSEPAAPAKVLCSCPLCSGVAVAKKEEPKTKTITKTVKEIVYVQLPPKAAPASEPEPAFAVAIAEPAVMQQSEAERRNIRGLYVKNGRERDLEMYVFRPGVGETRIGKVTAGDEVFLPCSRSEISLVFKGGFLRKDIYVNQPFRSGSVAEVHKVTL